MSRKPNKSLTAAKARKSRAMAAGILSAMAELDIPEMDRMEKFGIRCMSNNQIGVMFDLPNGYRSFKAFAGWAEVVAELRGLPVPPRSVHPLLLLPDTCVVEVFLAGAELHLTRPVSVLGDRSFQMACVPLSMFGAA